MELSQKMLEGKNDDTERGQGADIEEPGDTPMARSGMLRSGEWTYGDED